MDIWEEAGYDTGLKHVARDVTIAVIFVFGSIIALGYFWPF